MCLPLNVKTTWWTLHSPCIYFWVFNIFLCILNCVCILKLNVSYILFCHLFGPSSDLPMSWLLLFFHAVTFPLCLQSTTVVWPPASSIPSWWWGCMCHRATCLWSVHTSQWDSCSPTWKSTSTQHQSCSQMWSSTSSNPHFSSTAAIAVQWGDTETLVYRTQRHVWGLMWGTIKDHTECHSSTFGVLLEDIFFTQSDFQSTNRHLLGKMWHYRSSWKDTTWKDTVESEKSSSHLWDVTDLIHKTDLDVLLTMQAPNE